MADHLVGSGLSPFLAVALFFSLPIYDYAHKKRAWHPAEKYPTGFLFTIIEIYFQNFHTGFLSFLFSAVCFRPESYFV